MKYIYKCQTCDVTMETEKPPKIYPAKENGNGIYVKKYAHWKCPVCGNKKFLPELINGNRH